LIINFIFIQPIDDDQEDEHLIDEARNMNSTLDIWNHPVTSTPMSPNYISHARSDTNLIINIPSSPPNEILNDNNDNDTIKSMNEARRTRSMFTTTKCSTS